ncbi:hypothetical protein GE061_006984 [Apolygus lucorum]|uniref:Uncharacterized protein n=1 Tax=Apolygus lucorum TaxID=248454 RepID=A0A8S9WS71_APOLU|nr:hypothetical protein GE061_006984 [Apolygus lucorum]
MNSLSSLLNTANNQVRGILRLTDLRVGATYEVLSFHRICTQFGPTVVANLVPLGGSSSPEGPIRVFLPKRFTEVLTEEEIQKYNSKVTRTISLVYKGIVNRQHDLQFI